MAEKYKRKHLHNLYQLDREQEKIRRTCRNMENDWLSGIVNPQQIALGIAGSLLSRSKKSKKKNKQGIQPEKGAALSSEGTSSAPAINAMRNIISNPTIKTFLKHTATSWLRWQAFNLAIYLGKKAFKSIRHNREEKKLKAELEKLARQSLKK